MTRSRWSLAEFNAATDTEALAATLRECCAAHSWVEHALAGRPYPDVESLRRNSDAATAALDDAGFAQALAAHPRIGARVSGRSGAEQAGMAGADGELRARLAAANAAYEQRFGRVYLICATGLSAAELLDRCEERVGNDPVTERAVALGELAKINRIRLSILLDS